MTSKGDEALTAVLDEVISFPTTTNRKRKADSQESDATTNDKRRKVETTASDMKSSESIEFSSTNKG